MVINNHIEQNIIQMKKSVSRRRFLGNLSIAAAGMAMFSSSALNSNKNEAALFQGYIPNAPEGADLRSFMSTARAVQVKGRLFDRASGRPLANQCIEIWHLSPDGKNYRHRGRFHTSDNGSYSFLTDLPGKEEGKMPRINFKINSDTDSYLTSLILGSNQAFIMDDHWERNQSLGNDVFPQRTEELSKSIIQFNISI